MCLYWIAFTLFLALLGGVVIDWRDVKRCLPAALAGVVLAGVHAGLPAEFMPGILTDTGPITSNLGLTLVMQAVNAPILAIWFVQGARPAPQAMLRRALTFSGMTTCTAWMAAQAGRMLLAPWWNVFFCSLGYLAWYVVIWRVHLFCGGECPEQATSSPHVQG